MRIVDVLHCCCYCCIMQWSTCRRSALAAPEIRRPAWGRPVRIPSALAERIDKLANDTGLPFAMVLTVLAECGFDNQPDWLQMKAQDYQRRQGVEVVA